MGKSDRQPKPCKHCGQSVGWLADHYCPVILNKATAMTPPNSTEDELEAILDRFMYSCCDYENGLKVDLDGEYSIAWKSIKHYASTKCSEMLDRIEQNFAGGVEVYQTDEERKRIERLYRRFREAIEEERKK